MAQAAGDLGVIAGGNAKNQYTKTYRDLRPVPPGDDALEIARQNATISRGTARQNATAPEELTRESEDPGAAPAMEETYPILPHLEFSEEELEIRHPSLKAPAEERLEDVLRDGDDVVYNHGLAIAQEIQEEVAELGRRRHAVPDKERLDAVSTQKVMDALAVNCAKLERSIAEKETIARRSAPTNRRHPARDPQVPEVHGAAHHQTALPALGARALPGFQDGHRVPVASCIGAPGGGPGLFRGPPQEQLHPSPVASAALRTSRVRPRARRSAAGGVRE